MGRNLAVGVAQRKSLGVGAALNRMRSGLSVSSTSGVVEVVYKIRSMDPNLDVWFKNVGAGNRWKKLGSQTDFKTAHRSTKFNLV